MNILLDSMLSDKMFSNLLSHQVGITKFADMTQEEFARTYLNLNFNAFALVNLKPVKVKITNVSPMLLIVVSAVKDQG